MPRSVAVPTDRAPPDTGVPGHVQRPRHCLWLRHLDDEPGDRRSPCGQPMGPVAIEVRRDGEWALVHRCAGCGLLRTSRVAGDDAVLPLLALAIRPLARPAFPLDSLDPSQGP